MTRPALILAIVLAAWTPAAGQVPVLSREVLQTGLPWLDDIEILPDGTWIVSFPQLDQVVQMQPGGTPIPFHSGRVQGMALDPFDGSLWVSDFLQGTVSRIDLSTYQVTQVIGGFDHPIEVLFLDLDHFVVGSLRTPDYQTGIGDLRLVDRSGPAPVVTPLLLGALVGGMDVAVDGQGRIFVSSLGSTVLMRLDQPSLTLLPVASPLWQPADLLVVDGAILAATLLDGGVQRIDPDALPPVVTPLDQLLAGPGPGCEDLALDPEGRLVVTLTNGEIHRLRITGDLTQVGAALGGLSFQLVLDLPGAGAAPYQVVAAFGLGTPIPVPGSGGVLLLALDPLFAWSLDPLTPFFTGFSGTLGLGGGAAASVLLPPLPASSTLDLWFQAAAFAPGPQVLLTDALRVRCRG